MKTEKTIRMTKAEKELYHKLSDCWNSFIELPAYHDNHLEYFKEHIDALKHIVGLRVAYRSNPEIFRMNTKNFKYTEDND